MRTSLSEQYPDDAGVVRAYKSLARVERAFRSLKTSGLRVRPIFHWNVARVRACLLVCMLAYYLEWYLRQRLAPLLFSDKDRHDGQHLAPTGHVDHREFARDLSICLRGSAMHDVAHWHRQQLGAFHCQLAYS